MPLVKPTAHRRSEPSSLIVVGAGGFGREALPYIRDAIALDPAITIKGFLDDKLEAFNGKLDDLPMIGRIRDYRIESQDRFIVTIGNPEARADVTRSLEKRGAKFFTLIHPTANIASTAKVGTGCIIYPFCGVGNQANVGEHVVMTWYSSVAHDTVLEPFSMLSAYSTLNGGAVLEEGAFLGTHAVVNPLVRIGAWSRVAAGSVVYKSVGPRLLAMGNPARALPLMNKLSEQS